MQIKKIYQKYFGEEFKWILLLTLFVVLLNFQFLSTLKQLPVPIYGGDFYNHLGSIYHLYYGGSLFTSGQLLNEVPWVPWLYHVYVLSLSWITGMDPLFANIYSSLPIMFLTTITFYLLLKRYTDNTWLLSAAILSILKLYPIYKYTEFSFYVVAPALILSWLLFLEKQTTKRMFLLIIIIAISNLTNTQLFFTQYILFGVIILNEIHKNYQKNKNFQSLFSQQFIAHIKPFFIVLLVSFAISLLYWYWPIFVYMGKTPNDLQTYGWVDFSKITNQISYPFEQIKSMFFGHLFGFSGLSSLMNAIIGILQFLGFFLIIKYRNKDFKHNFVFLVLIASLLALFHHMISYNLLKIHFAPERMYQALQFTLGTIQMIFALGWLSEKIKENAKEPNSQLNKIDLNIIGQVALLIVLVTMVIEYTEKDKNQWNLVALDPVPSDILLLKDWVVKNTKVNDVFITNNEDAFMMNAFTGRKTVSYRRTHAPVYTDMDQRMLDTAVILYGNNNAVREELLKKYKVKYVLWTVQWLRNEFIFSDDDQLVGFFDPLMVKSNEKYKKYLDENGVRYSIYNSYLDPAWLKSYPTYDVLVVLPTNFDVFHPWHNDFDTYLNEVEKVQSSQNKDIPFAIVYEVKYGQ